MSLLTDKDLVEIIEITAKILNHIKWIDEKLIEITELQIDHENRIIELEKKSWS